MATPSSNDHTTSAVYTSMLCAATVTAQFVAGKAARDALYLGHLDVSTLPVMVMATAAFSILLAFGSSKALRMLSPARLVPTAFFINAVMLLLEWPLVRFAPAIGAPIVYLQISGIGPALGSGFWLIVTERFDPRTAKRRFGQIAGMGTLGGLIGGLMAERLAVFADIDMMLPVLAALNVICAWQIRVLATPLDEMADARAMDLAPEIAPSPWWSGVEVLTKAPYLRNLAALVVLGTISAEIIDYAFKAQAAATFTREESLLRFFAVFYAAISLTTFVLQTAASGVALQRLGLAVTTGSPSLMLVISGLGSLIVPGMQGLVVARGAESAFRGSLFRAGYELFFTPIPREEKRAAKSIIDVGFDRLGDAVGGGIIRLALLAPLAVQPRLLVSLAVGFAGAALFAASRLNRGYVQTLERSLINRALALDLGDAEDATTRTAIMQSMSTMSALPRPGQPPPTHATAAPAPPSTPGPPASGAGLDTDMLQMLALRSRDRARVLRVLQSSDTLPDSLLPHVIPLLAWDAVANDALIALAAVSERHIGALVDALIDPSADFAVRRRLPRVLCLSRTQRAVDGLILGLDDSRFEVRYQCARAVARIVHARPDLTIDADRVFAIVLRETAVGRPVWESNRLLHALDDRDDEHLFLDDYVRDRASRSLAHVFTLLSLVLPAEPLQIAFRGLHVDDRSLRGTALEYLESVLPPVIREALWPFLEDSRTPARANRPREAIMADLLRSNESIMINLEDLKRVRRGSSRDPS